MAGLGSTPNTARAQDDDLAATCAASSSECYLAAAAVRLVQPRVGLALWGGSPVPGSASTLGMRLGSFPRVSVAGRLTLVPMELPPLADLADDAGERGYSVGVSGQSTIGVFSGFSPAPTVGGVLSIDAIARLSWASLPGEDRFDEGGVIGGSAGVRVGVIRESFTLPGVSLTGSYGHSSTFAYGQPGRGDGSMEGGVGGWNATLAVSKRLGPIGLTGGAAWDRYTSRVDLEYPGGPAGGESADARTERWSAFVNASWTVLIFHGSLEAGWQEAPTPERLPSGVSVDPVGWWLGAGFRVTI